MTEPAAAPPPTDPRRSDDGRDTARSTPPWWPEGEAWPPAHRSGRHGPWHAHDRAQWGHGPGKRWRPFGCLFLLFGLFAAGTMVIGIWAAAAILGFVEAPAIVVGAGVIAFVLIALGAVVAARAFRRLSQPLDELIAASGRIEAGDYGARVDVGGSGEMRSLARAFNQMSERLEVSDARRRAFLADVAHELRTPLTVMQGQLEAIGDGVYAADEEHIEVLLGHTRQMARLVEDLRTISLAEVGALRLNPLPTDLVALTHEVVAAYRSAASERDIELLVDAPGPVVGPADAAALRRVLSNLITNAIRHSSAGGDIRIGLESAAGDHGPTIAITDDGDGMSAELVTRAFERFEKGPASDGSGLGLPIARDLIEAQGGRIELHSRPGSGTTARVRLGVTAADANG